MHICHKKLQYYYNHRMVGLQFQQHYLDKNTKELVTNHVLAEKFRRATDGQGTAFFMQAVKDQKRGGVNGILEHLMESVKSAEIETADLEAIIKERRENGMFKNLKDFIERLSGKEVNKRTMENFIKAGAFDGMEGNRRQKMQVYAQIIDEVNREKHKDIRGPHHRCRTSNFL